MRGHFLLTIAILAAAVACREDGGRERSASPGASAEELSGAATLTPTEYVTSLLFVPAGSAPSRAIVFELSNHSGPAGLAQHYRGWELTRSGWRNVLDAESQGAGTRAPWRLFPIQSLHFTVTADGDPNALILQNGSASHTLDLADELDRWEDRAGTQHEIRRATWSQAGQRIAGISVQHRFAIAEPELPGRFGPYERAVLRSEDGALIVLFHTREPELYGDPYAWMYADGLTRRWTSLETRTVEVANAPQLRRNVPIRTWFRIPEPEIRGELTAAERAFDGQGDAAGPKPYHGLYRIRGWIEFEGERRNVEGVLERGEP